MRSAPSRSRLGSGTACRCVTTATAAAFRTRRSGCAARRGPRCRSRRRWAMAETSDALALVTGASTGIGFELARCFADDGHGLIVVAEEEGPLLEAATMLRQAGAPRVET